MILLWEELIVIQEKLSEIFREVLADDTLELALESSPDDIEDWDSLSQVLIVEQVEKEFGIKLELDEVFKIRTFGDFVKMIEGHLEK